MTINFRIIGLRIQETRRRKRLSQAELAEQVDLSVSYISHIERAKKQTSLESLVKIANVLGVTADLLLNGNQSFDQKEYMIELVDLLNDCDAYEKRVIYETVCTLKKSLRDNRYLRYKEELFQKS